MSITSLCELSDAQLACELERAAGRERQATLTLLLHLAEFDSRGLYAPAGFSSLFTYCVGVLRLSESEAYNRIEAARAIRRWPQVVERVRAGELNLTTLRLVAPHLTAETLEERLRAASGRTKREVEELVAKWAPKERVESSVRKAPPQTERKRRGATDLTIHPEPAAAMTGTPDRGPALPAPTAIVSVAPRAASRCAKVEPLAEDAYLVRFKASAALRAKIRRAQDLLRHSVPTGDLGETFGRAIDLLLLDVEGRKAALVARPQPPPRSRSQRQLTHSRHIPAAVRREVWTRDNGRCAFKGRQGRCHETSFIEFHHREPYAVGGESTVGNIELRCRAHNVYESQLVFGIPSTIARGRSGASTHSSSASSGT